MRFIHRDAAEPALPEMPGPFLARMCPSGICAMNLAQCAAQAIRVRRDKNAVNMVGISTQLQAAAP